MCLIFGTKNSEHQGTPGVFGSAVMDLLSVFRMCMLPEQYIKDVFLKETNKHLEEMMTLSESYKWLGCRFYMAC